MRPDCAQAAAAFQLALRPISLSGRLGERLGQGVGSSLEFMDFRSYVPGDDLRHIDWRGYARTDQLQVRLYREEVAPVCEIVVDASFSMGVTPEKEQALRDLVEAFCSFAKLQHAQVRKLLSDGGFFEDGDSFPLQPIRSGELLPQVALRPRSIRILISDFLFPEDPSPALRRFCHHAAQVFVIQLLLPWEIRPQDFGIIQLLDPETGERMEIDVNEQSIALYQKRLQTLQSIVEETVRGAGGLYACVPASSPQNMFQNILLPAGMLEPRK